jgi:hypothetical protein
MFSFLGVGCFADMSGGKHCWLFNICPQILLLLREMWARNVGKFNLQYPHSIPGRMTAKAGNARCNPRECRK